MIIQDNIKTLIVVGIESGTIFKNLAVIGITDTNSCNNIEPITVNGINIFDKIFFSNIDVFSLIQFRTLIF